MPVAPNAPSAGGSGITSDRHPTARSRLTRESTGKKATYKREGSRKALFEDPAFRAEYDRAKQRIRAMSVRWVVEADPTTQALLEIYVAIATGARYNDFDTH